MQRLPPKLSHNIAAHELPDISIGSNLVATCGCCKKPGLSAMYLNTKWQFGSIVSLVTCLKSKASMFSCKYAVVMAFFCSIEQFFDQYRQHIGCFREFMFKMDQVKGCIWVVSGLTLLRSLPRLSRRFSFLGLDCSDNPLRRHKTSSVEAAFKPLKLLPNIGCRLALSDVACFCQNRHQILPLEKTAERATGLLFFSTTHVFVPQYLRW